MYSGSNREVLLRRSNPVALLAVAALLLGLLGIAQFTAGSAQAAAVTIGKSVNHSGAKGTGAPFYAYLKEGEYLYVQGTAINNVIDESGTSVGTGSHSGGVEYGPAQADGIWRLGATGAANWQIEPRETAGGTAIDGRVWVDSYHMEDSGYVNLTFWALSDTGYQYKVHMPRYYGQVSQFVINSIGYSTAQDCTANYASEERVGSTNDVRNYLRDCGGLFKLFFEEPAADLPESAEIAGTTEWVKPTLLTAEELAESTVVYDVSPPQNDIGGDFKINIDPRFTGTFWLEIDADGNGDWDDDVDLRVPLTSVGDEVTYAFDGLDGQGEQMFCGSPNARLAFESVGEMHFTLTDTEGLADGIEVIRQNGPGAPDATVYWDDSGLTTSGRSSVTPILDGTAGVDSTGGVHGWSSSGGNPWGDKRVIDTWAHVELDSVATEPIAFGECPEPGLSIEKTVDSTEITEDGQEVTYTVTVENIGNVDYSGDPDASFSDDLSDVLDDAVLDEDSITASSGTATFDAATNSLSWVGPLEVGESATVTYTVSHTGGGNDELVNMACVPESAAAGEDVGCVSVTTTVNISDETGTTPEDDPKTDPGDNDEDSGSDDEPKEKTQLLPTGGPLAAGLLGGVLLAAGAGIRTLTRRRD